MIDNDMTNILKNFSNADSGTGEVIDATTGKTKVSAAATGKNAMKSLLEGLDAQQSSVNQMPGTHTMAKNGAKHPASQFLVGGEFDDEPEMASGLSKDTQKYLDAHDGDVDSALEQAYMMANLGRDPEWLPIIRELKGLSPEGVEEGRYEDEGADFYDGQQVELVPPYEERRGEVYTLSNWDGRKGWIGDKDGRGWGVSASQIKPHEEDDDDIEDDYYEDASEDTALSHKDVANAWMEVFPNSSVGVGKAFGGGYTFKFRLAKDQSEVASKIMDNDPLNYTALLDENGNWKEWSSSMFVAPEEGSYNVYSSVKFRKKSAKNVKLDQIQKRFKQVKAFVAQNADKMHRIHFDIGEKLGTGAIKETNEAPIQPGANVHVGHHTAGGSGVEGEVTRVEDGYVYIRNAEGKTYKGLLKNTTVSENLDEAKSADNFTPEDLHALSSIKDLETLKARAMELISNPDSTRPMKPEKVAWFRRNMEQKTNPAAVIKLMWDLLLAGEGSKVIGSKGSTRSSNYRTKFGEDTLGKQAAPKTQMNKKQSLADIFRSMDETEEDLASRFKKELHDEKTKAALTKGDNGKFNLAEEEDTDWGIGDWVHPRWEKPGQREPMQVLSVNGSSVVVKDDSGNKGTMAASDLVRANSSITEEDPADDGKSHRPVDPRITHMLNKAKVQYAGTPDDFSALVHMMGDEQKTQNTDINDLGDHNGFQDTEIDHEEHINVDQEAEIADLRSRLEKLENEGTIGEEIVPDGDEYLDDETGQIFRPDEIMKDPQSGKYIEKDLYQDPNQEPSKAAVDWGLPEPDYEPEPVKDRINYKLLAQKIEDAVQMSFPDGDPLNQLMHYSDQLERNGQTLSDALDKAAQQYLGATDYNDYLANFWDDYTSDNPDPDMDQSNPWRESIGEAGRREVKKNWFETLNAALESEGLVNTWDMTMGGISYGENRSYNAVDGNGQCRHISIYRETDGRYERPVHYPTKGC